MIALWALICIIIGALGFNYRNSILMGCGNLCLDYDYVVWN